MLKYLFGSIILCGFQSSAAAATPLFLDGEPERSGLEQSYNARGSNPGAIQEYKYNETLTDGRAVEVLVRVPAENKDAPATPVSAIVFVAPAPTDHFDTARTKFSKALVTGLGCAVVAIPMDASENIYWVREKFYVYPEAGYFSVVEKAILKARERHADAKTPVFCFGKSAGGVMALYLAQSKTLEVAGVVAYNLSQDTDVAPGMLDVKTPALLVSPESSPWNGRIARLHAEAAQKGAPLAFCIGRPVIKPDADRPYAGGSVGRYGDELAYCFFRDAIEAHRGGQWPQRWQHRSVKIEGVGEIWEESVYCTSADFEKLYKLATHNTYEALPTGERSYAALPPFLRRHAILVIKKGIWHYLDQVRLGSMLVHQGCAAVICSAPGAEAAALYLPAQLARLKKLGVPVTVIAIESKDADWERAVASAVGDIKCVFVRRGEALMLPPKSESRMNASLCALPGYKKKDYETVSSAVETWLLPKDFDALITFLITPEQTPVPPAKD